MTSPESPAVQDTDLGGAQMLAAVSRWIDDHPANAARDAEARTLRDDLLWLTTERERLIAERDRLAETVRRVREVHSPVPDWEREWKDPIEALRKGWPPCAGCATVATFTPIGKCRTLAALRVGDIPSPTAPEAAE